MLDDVGLRGYSTPIDNATQHDMNQVFKNATISAKILAKMQAGMTVQQAIDAVLGEGTFMKLAGEVYDELRSKKA